jgi:hypothetical protein
MVIERKLKGNGGTNEVLWACLCLGNNVRVDSALQSFALGHLERRLSPSQALFDTGLLHGLHLSLPSRLDEERQKGQHGGRDCDPANPARIRVCLCMCGRERVR